MSGPLRIISQKGGIALLSVMFFFMIVTAIIAEVSYETSLEYIISSRVVHDLKARYAAKAGIELSLLRIHIYRQVMHQFGDKLGQQASMLDVIWQFPFMWPPVLPDQLGRAHKETVDKVVKESRMTARYLPTIQSEGSKIDINDLGSPSKGLIQATQKLILQIFENKVSGDDEEKEKFQDINFQVLVNNMIDWVDKDSESLNGGTEASYYPNVKSDSIPPNQPFKTIDELHMVAGMTDEVYDLLASRITVFGSKGINVNYASKEILTSIDPLLTSEIVDEIIKRRSDPALGGAFKDEKDFLSFIGGLGVSESEFKGNNIPLLFDTEYNFTIKSTGEFGQVTREIVAIVYDFDRVKTRLDEIVGAEEKKNESSSSEEETDAGKSVEGSGKKNTTEESKTKKGPAPKGRPRVVFWFET